MNKTQLVRKFKDWRDRGNAAAALREEFSQRILVLGALTLVAQAALLLWFGIPQDKFFLTTGMPAGWLLVAITCRRGIPVLSRRNGIAAAPLEIGPLFSRIALFVCVIETVTLPAVRYNYAQYGGAVVLTIVLAGLLLFEWYVYVYVAMACVLHLSLHDYPGWSWSAYAGWCAVYIAVGWIVTLYAKNIEQLAEAGRAADEQQRSAIVAERTRFARDMHDTLAQGFTGIMMQLNAAEQRLKENAQQARLHIEKARQLATDSLEEAQRSVSALRNAALANGTLLDAIEQIGRTLTPDSDIRLEPALEGAPYALPEQCEANLLRIAQEALTNAVRHAGAAAIKVLLAYRADSVVLEVGDTGRGMTGRESSGFGIDGMRERAREIGGEIKILSDPGRGTRVIVTVPNV